MIRKVLLFYLLGVLLVAFFVMAWLVIPDGARKADFRFAGDSIHAGDRFASLLISKRSPARWGSRSMGLGYGVDLVLHDVADARKIEVITIVENGDETKLRNGTKLLGSDGQHLWLYAETLVGLDLKTKKKIGFQDLSRANPGLASFWIEEAKFYSVGGAVPKLRLKVADARQFELDSMTLVGTPYENEKIAAPKSHEESMKQWTDYFDKMSMLGVGPEVYFWKGDKLGEEDWFVLMTREEAAKLLESGVPTGRAIRAGKTSGLYRVKSRVPEKVGGVEYLDAGFLRDPKAAKPMRLEGPAGYLVMHRSRLGEDGKLVLTRVDLEGKKIWEVNTGIGELDQVLPDSKYLGLVGQEPKAMVSVNLADGNLTLGEFFLTWLK